MKMPWTIYCHTHIESGRKYIGLTSQTMEKRWKNHIHAALNSKGGRWHFPNAVRKYGKDAFSHEVLEICQDLESANLAEEKLIVHFDTRNPEKGFNLTKGGLHTPHPIKKNPWDDQKYRAKLLLIHSSPEYLAKLSKAAKIVWFRPEFKKKQLIAKSQMKLKLSNINKGKIRSVESRIKQSISQIGRIMSHETKMELSSINKGKTNSIETRKKLSIAGIGRIMNPETKIKLYNSNKGKIHSIETRKKISTILINKNKMKENKEILKVG